MNEVQQEKWRFVNAHVAPMCMELDSSIDKLWYSVKNGTELVTIQRHNKSVVRIDVYCRQLSGSGEGRAEDFLKGVRM